MEENCKDSWQKSDVEKNFALKGLSAKKSDVIRRCAKKYPWQKSEVKQKFGEKVILYDDMQS